MKYFRLFLILLIITLIGCEQDTELVKAKVLQVYDGDTIEVLLDGKKENIRFIGIDTPETNHPKRDVEVFGPEASKANREFVGDDYVYLEFDISLRDRYDRMLAYVYDQNKEMINLKLARGGFADLLTYPPNIKYTKQFEEAAAYARENGLGLWGTFKKINMEESFDYIGHWVELDFVIHSVSHKGKITFLNSSEDYDNDFTVVVFERDLPNFPGIDSWQGKSLTIKGKLVPYDGPEIVLKEKWQIIKLEEVQNEAFAINDSRWIRY